MSLVQLNTPQKKLEEGGGGGVSEFMTVFTIDEKLFDCVQVLLPHGGSCVKRDYKF